MPRVNPQELAPSEIYGKVKVNNNLTMGERIRKRFRPTDTVRVHNITNAEISWQWLDELDETYTIEEGSNVKIVEREDPQVWRLGPGEKDILQGSCAYIMIEALYKQVCAMKTGIVLHPLDEREIRNFAFDDPVRQEEFIDYVYKGKLTPQMMQEAAASSLGDMAPEVVEKLPAIATEKDEFSRRNRARRAEAERRVHQANTPADLKDLADEFDDGDNEPVTAAPPAQETPVGKVELGTGQVGDLIGEDREKAEAAGDPIAPTRPVAKPKPATAKTTAKA